MAFWNEHKKTIVTTAIVVLVGLLVIRFFDVIFLVGVLVALGVSGVLAWNHLTKKYGGLEGVWKAFLAGINHDP